MPALEPAAIKSIFYIYPSMEDAEKSTEFGGTGFFVWIPSEINSQIGFLYGVTCWHVIHDCRPNPVIRINTNDGKFDRIQTNYDDWIRHPDDDDVAVTTLALGEQHNFSFGYLLRDYLKTHEIT